MDMVGDALVVRWLRAVEFEGSLEVDQRRRTISDGSVSLSELKAEVV